MFQNNVSTIRRRVIFPRPLLTLVAYTPREKVLSPLTAIRYQCDFYFARPRECRDRRGEAGFSVEKFYRLATGRTEGPTRACFHRRCVV